MASRHQQVREFYERDAAEYQINRWSKDEVALANYTMTKEALLEALWPTVDERILEIGCGSGTWTQVVAQRCRELTAIDISANMLALAQDYVTAANVTFIQGDFARHQPEGAYDKVFAIRVFEHFQDKGETLCRIRNSLRDGGRVVIITKTVPSIWNGRVRINRTLRRLFRRQALGRQEYEAQFWMERITPWRLQRMLAASGFINIWVGPVILRLPILARGEDEYPLVFPPLESKVLDISLRMAQRVRQGPVWLRYLATFCSESYLVTAVSRV